ncbi:MAG: four helix bundle protein [Patescibacteria group bacterium]|nr:four helix bundle protein [Patescibacteria group bacterium]MDD4610445.1 four helix bundle protein [Patescibacteria group bacterium]
MNKEELKERTKKFSLRIIRLVNSLPNNKAGYAIGNQLIRSGTSVGANYRAVCRAKSKADFIAKLGVVIEEADETVYWLELIIEGGILSKELVMPLLQEANELTAIMVASRKTISNS